MRFLFNSPHILIRRIAPLQQWTAWDTWLYHFIGIVLASKLYNICESSTHQPFLRHDFPTSYTKLCHSVNWIMTETLLLGCCMLWLRYAATFLDFSVAMKFTEWHIVHVYPAQCSTNFLKLYNAAYIQFSLFSLFVFHTFFSTIATFVCSPIYLTMLWWPVHMKAHPLVWFEHFLLYFKEYKRFRYKFKILCGLHH